jgi:uncharacterized protein
MPEYLHPGVYIEEQPAPQTIEGVSTSTAGFVGATEKGPTAGLPRLVTSFADFTRLYGGYLPAEPWGDKRFLAYAVEAFFNNGGQRVYIKRVVGEGAQAASLTLNDGFIARLTEDMAGEPNARNTVLLSSLRGISVGSELQFEESIAGRPETGSARVRSYDSAKKSVTLESPLDMRFTAEGCRVTLAGTPAPSAGTPRLTVRASSEGAWGRQLRVTVADMDGAIGLAESRGVQTTLRSIDLAFAAGGPGQNATSVELASASEVQLGDVVEFENSSGERERRTITQIDGDEISWEDELSNDYSSGSSIRRVAVVRGGVVLALDADGPAAGATEAVLADVSRLDETGGDVIEFRTADGTFERRTTTGVDTSTRTVSWNEGVTNDYSGSGSSLLLLRDQNPVVPVASTAGFSTGDVARLAHGAVSQLIGVSSVDTDNRTITLDTSTRALERDYEAGGTLTLATAGRNGSDRLDLRAVSNFYPRAVIEIDDGREEKIYSTVARIEGRSLVLTSSLGRDVFSGATVRAVEFSLLFEDDTTSERFANLSMDQNASNFVENVVNPRSRLVQVEVLASARGAPFNLPRTSSGAAATLQGGNNGQPPTADHYRGDDNGPGRRTGIKALEDIDRISIVAAPGINDDSVQAELVMHCELLKDRFAVLDPARGSVVGGGNADDVIVQRGNHDTLYAAMYYPWLRIRDPLDPDAANGTPVPPSGHVIGIYARVDVERGVHKAPANEVVRGIIGLEVKLNDREQGILNPHPTNINVIRDFRDSNRGIRVWGARVITSDNAWKYVPVRRLFIFVEESLDEGLQWVVFEPNAEPLWARVHRTVTGFLRRVWRDDALAGVTEDEAFFVRCDRSTMTEDDIANGRLIVLVGIAPVHPAEFVIIRIGQKTLEATLEATS